MSTNSKDVHNTLLRKLKMTEARQTLALQETQAQIKELEKLIENQKK